MSFSTFFILSAVAWAIGVAALAVGVTIYLKRRGVLRAAADAASDAVKQDVQDAADKLTK